MREKGYTKSSTSTGRLVWRCWGYCLRRCLQRISTLYGIQESFTTGLIIISQHLWVRAYEVPLIIGETDRTIGAFGAIMLLLAIMYSPFLKKFLSQRIFVYLGGISFPLYLLHGTWIRIFLTWALYRFLPQFRSLNVAEFLVDVDGETYVWMICDSITCKFVVAVVWCIWLSSLLAFCRIWKEYVDILGVQLSQWAEAVVLGKKPLIDLTAWPEFRNDWLMSRKSSMNRDTEKVS
jgi:hypothetical protein